VATRRHGDGIEQQDEAADEISVTFDALPAPPAAPIATLPGPSLRPSNAFSILTPQLNARTGAATLRFRLAGPGLLRGLAAAATYVGASSARAAGAPPDCGHKHSPKFRWAQKTLQDKCASNIHSNPVQVVIAGLSQLAPPKPLGPKTPRHGWEFNQVEIWSAPR
jgi:hypothetical protein